MNPNLYATKKTLAQGMLRRGPALGQRHPAEKHHSARGDDHEFYTVLVVLISFSPSDCRYVRETPPMNWPLLEATPDNGECRDITCEARVTKLLEELEGANPDIIELSEILVGMVFLVLGFINLNKDKNHRMAEILNNIATAAVFAVTVLNILTASFDGRKGIEGRPSEAQPLIPR
ncbi:hypothetical protein MRX96_026078 [Rhipicephalus microplus]